MVMAQASLVDDQALVQAAQYGEEPAFAELFRRYYGLVYRLAFRLVGSAEEADDLVQEVFLRLYQRPPVLADGESLRPWLSRVTANLGLNTLRAHRRSRDRLLRWLRLEWPLKRDEAERELELREATDVARELLATLPERDRVILVLRHSGLTYEEIASAVGVQPNSVGTLLARAERRVRDRYRRACETAREEG
jgi:RNA polymerase sigma-70 factor (ECF subfamily)